MANMTLNMDEEEALLRFSTGINAIRKQADQPELTLTKALLFLHARKFNVERAIELYHGYENMLSQLDIAHDYVPSGAEMEELQTGKFLVPQTRDADDSALVFFVLREHVPSLRTKEASLRALVFELNEVVSDISVQQAGISFIIDMTQAGWMNFDYGLYEAVVSTLQNKFPARLRRIRIVHAPWWATTFVRTMQLLRPKLKERVGLVGNLGSVMDMDKVPSQVGGNLQYVHSVSLLSRIDASKCRHAAAITVDQIVPADDIPAVSRKSEKPPPPPPRDDVSSQAAERPPLPQPSIDNECSVDILKQKLIAGTDREEFIALSREQPRSTHADYESAMLPHNAYKNRYINVLPLESTRVFVPRAPSLGDNPGDSSDEEEEDPSFDYINANWVDGFNRPRAYIASQGPLPDTFGSHWRIVWHNKVRVIVMATREVENNRMKCHRYWPDADKICTYDEFTLTAGEITELPDVTRREFIITSSAEPGVERSLTQFQYHGWPDHGVPTTARNVLDFWNIVRDLRDADPHQAPILVHCSAGIGRSGTVMAIDIGMDMAANNQTINPKDIVTKLRSQRSGTVQTPDQYTFIILALAEYLS